MQIQKADTPSVSKLGRTDLRRSLDEIALDKAAASS